MITIFLHYVLISAGMESGGPGLLIAIWFLLVWVVVLLLIIISLLPGNWDRTMEHLRRRNRIEKEIEREYGIIDFSQEDKKE